MQNACINLTEAARSEQLFKINGHTAMRRKPSCAASRMWTVGGFDWKIQYYYYSNCCFRLILVSAASEVDASFSCRLVDPNAKLAPSQEKSATATFGQNSFVDVGLTSGDELSRAGYLKDDYFLVRCAVTVFLGEPKVASAESDDDEVAPRDAAPSSDLQMHLGELLRSKKGADVTFVVSGEPVAAHRCVLAARSPVFMAQLYGGMMEEGSWRVEIKDVQPEVFRALLHFIYTDVMVPELRELEKEQATAMAQHLLVAADRYGLGRLKAICEVELCNAISLDTVATMLALAEQHGCLKLKVRCMEFVVATPKNLDAITATESYKRLMASCPSLCTDILKVMAARNK